MITSKDVLLELFQNTNGVQVRYVYILAMLFQKLKKNDG
jgi:hypothetical protein